MNNWTLLERIHFITVGTENRRHCKTLAKRVSPWLVLFKMIAVMIRKVNYVIFFGLLYSTRYSEGVFRSSCRRNSLMVATDIDKQLARTAHDIISEKYAHSLLICGRLCITEEQCRSINYKAISSPDEKNCQLLAITKSNASSVVTNANGWIHYEHVLQVLYNVVLNITTK